MLAVSPVAEAGGAEVLLLDVLGGLRARGAAVLLVALGEGPLFDLARRRQIPVAGGPPLTFRRLESVLRAAACVRRAARAFGPDIVHASHPKGQVIARLGCGRLGSVHSVQLFHPPDRDDLVARFAHRIPALHFAMTEELAARHRASNRRMQPVVVHPGSDLAALSRRAGAGDGEAAWRALRPAPAGEPRIVMVGRLQRFKGPFDFVDMAAEVSRARPDARFLVIGPDSPVEPGLRAELRDRIRLLGLDGVVGLAGRLAEEDLAATIAGATLLVHPAHDEPFGLAVVEALALRTPVVAYAAAGPQLILASGGGALVPVGDVPALATAVLGALSSGAVRRWSAEAAETASRFGMSAVVEGYARAFEAALATVPRVVTVGVVPPGPSGVADHGRLLAGELRRRGVAVGEHWLVNDGRRLRTTVAMAVGLQSLGTTIRSPTNVIWHYSPSAYGYRGVPGPEILFANVLRLRGVAVVAVLHELAHPFLTTEGWRGRLTAVLHQCALRVVVQAATCVVVTTEKRADALRRQRLMARRPVRVVPVFSNIAPSAPVAPGDGRFTVCVPGYAGAGVRPDLLIHALATNGSTAIPIVLPGAPGPDSPDGRRWRSLADSAGLGERLEFTGTITAEEFSRRLREASVVVLVNEEGPSSRKGTLAMAMAHGRPIISLDGPNRWDELVESEAVLVVPPDADALASAVSALRAEEAARAALGARAAAFYRDRMSLERAGAAFVECLT